MPPVLAADIAGNDGWKPLSQSVADYDIDPVFIDQALDSGGEINCVRKKPDGKKSYQTLVGWFLNGDASTIVTSGHVMYEDDTKRTDFSNCYIAMNRDVLATAEADYPRLKIDPDVGHYRFGGLDPAGPDKGQDRATLPLLDGAPSPSVTTVHPLATNPAIAESVAVGDEVFMLSSARPFHLKTSRGGFEPMLQRCMVLKVDISVSGNSNQVRTDCDSHRGVSGSLLFAHDPESPRELIPVGLASSTASYAGLDGRPPSAANNYAAMVLLDSRFFTMPFDGTALVPQAGNILGDRGIAE